MREATRPTRGGRGPLARARRRGARRRTCSAPSPPRCGGSWSCGAARACTAVRRARRRARPGACRCSTSPGRRPSAGSARRRAGRLRAAARDRGRGRPGDRRGIRRRSRAPPGGRRPVHRARGPSPSRSRTEVPEAQVHAVELSRPRAGWAARNRDRLGLDVDLRARRRGDRLRRARGRGRRRGEQPALHPAGAESRSTPRCATTTRQVALYGGSVDGLAIPPRGGGPGRGLLRPGGVLVMEHADGQGDVAPAGAAGDGCVGRRSPTTPTCRAATDHRRGAWLSGGARGALFDRGPSTEDVRRRLQDEDQQRDDEQHTDDRPDQVRNHACGAGLFDSRVRAGRSPGARRH